MSYFDYSSWLQFKEALEMINRRFKPILEGAGVPYTVEIVQNFSQSERVAQAVLRYLCGCLTLPSIFHFLNASSFYISVLPLQPSRHFCLVASFVGVKHPFPNVFLHLYSVSFFVLHASFLCGLHIISLPPVPMQIDEITQFVKRTEIGRC